jgi:putative ABC transport system ATP-binding protein
MDPFPYRAQANGGAWTRRHVLRLALRGGGRLRQTVLASLLLMGYQTGEALVPVVIGGFVDRATETSDAGALLRWLVLLVCVFAGLSLSWRFGWRVSLRVAETAEHDLRMQLTGRALDPHGHDGGDRLSGELLSTATNDAEQAGVLGQAIAFGCAGLASVGVTTVALLRVSVPLTILILTGLPPVLALMRLLGRPLERRSGAQQAAAAEAGGLATDLITGLRVVKGLGAERAAVARYRLVSRSSLSASVRAASSAGWYEAATLLVPGLFLAVVALVAGRLAAGGSITVGELIAVIGLAQFLAIPFGFLSFVGLRLAQARASAERIAEALSVPPAVAGGSALGRSAAAPGIAVEGATRGAVGPISFGVRPGEMVGVVTDHGETAEALLAWLGRHTDPESGTLTLDGRPFTEIDPDSLRATVVVSPHDADLFDGSVLDNVRALTPAAADVAPALAAATVDLLAADLPDRLDTRVGERGQALSGGQRQRVGLARALAADAPVLVLHDPTTAVDSVTEAAIAEGLRRVRRGRTTIVVTTSPALLGACERVVVVRDGRVHEGTHSALAAGDAAYRELVLS